jgi:hypothetical protein
MSKHTPGPWEWGDNGLYATHQTEGRVFSRPILYPVDGHTYSEHTQDPPSIECDNAADRNLIAAAPELLAALSALVAKIDACSPAIDSCIAVSANHKAPYAGPTWVAEMDGARAAIAKASPAGNPSREESAQ